MIARKILQKQFNLTIFCSKHRNVVTLDCLFFKPTQDEIARKKYAAKLQATTVCLHKFKRAVVYGTKPNRNVNTPETLQKAVSIQYEINCPLAQNPSIQNKQVTYLKYVRK